MWHEFMFACAMYPRDAVFLAEVAEEARQQTLRINSHPSVVVWGGNNEVGGSICMAPSSLQASAFDPGHVVPAHVHPTMTVASPPAVQNEAALTWFPATLAHRVRYAVDYSKLFVDTLRQVLLSIDPGAVYLDSSPSNGLVSGGNPYVKRWGDVNFPAMGDLHYYNYEDNLLDPGVYPPAQFVSEFGFTSLPSFTGELHEAEGAC